MGKETEKKYTYDAFISYRHSELDKFVAETLHKQLEAFRLPGNVSRKIGRKKIERVFRDKDELPLTSNLEDPIMRALAESEFLIVICSPRLKESLWCKKEIETFIRLHGREKVFAVLIEGEPEDSFPEELLFAEETVEKPDGTTEIVKKPMEPLAADIRGKNKHEMQKAMRTEILRLIAPMFSLTYDDLRQRHRERKMRRILLISLTGAAVCFAFGIVSTTMLLRIQEQKEQIQAQSAEIKAQSAEIGVQNRNLLTYQAISLAEEALRRLENGDRIGAIETARLALTSYNGHEMLYTEEAQYALTEALHVYDGGSKIKPSYQMETAGVIDRMLVSADRKIILTLDQSERLTLWDAASGTIIDTIQDVTSSISSESVCAFLGNDRIVYISEGRGTVVYDIASKKEAAVLEENFVLGVHTDKEGKYLAVRGQRGLHIYDAASLKLLYEYTAKEERSLGNRMVFCEDYLVFLEQQPAENATYWENEGFLYTWNLLDNVVSAPTEVGLGGSLKAQAKDGIAYITLNYGSDNYRSSSTVLRAYDLAGGKVLWSREYQDFSVDFIQRPYAEGAHYLMLASDYEIVLVDMEDGSEYTEFVLSSPAVGGAVFGSLDRFMLFTRNGEYHIIMVEEKQDYIMTSVFMCHSQNVMNCDLLDAAYLILPYQDNHATVYTYSEGEDREEYSGEITIPETVSLSYTEAVDHAKEKGLAQADMVSSMFYNTDESLLFVFYKDSALEVYNTADMSLQNRIEGISSVSLNTFFGTDKDGNLFIGGSGSDGYMLNADGKMLAKIENLVGVEQGGGRLFTGRIGEKTYVCPIYSLEELLAKAEAYVLR